MPQKLNVLETYFTVGKYTDKIMEWCKTDSYRECCTCPRRNLCHFLVGLQVELFDSIMKGKF